MADEVLLLGFNVGAGFFFDIALATWREDAGVYGEVGGCQYVGLIHSGALRRVAPRLHGLPAENTLRVRLG